MSRSEDVKFMDAHRLTSDGDGLLREYIIKGLRLPSLEAISVAIQERTDQIEALKVLGAKIRREHVQCQKSQKSPKRT